MADVLRDEMEKTSRLEMELRRLQNSHTYKVGRAIVAPLKLLRTRVGRA
jgi:hypothetical protein